MSNLQKVNLGTPPSAVDGDTVRTANEKANANVDVLNAQAALTSAADIITVPQALTNAHVGKRVNISLVAPGTINMPAASTCTVDNVILLRNVGATVVTLAVAAASGDTAALSKLNAGESALLDTDGVHAWSVLTRGRASGDAESVVGDLSVGADLSVGDDLVVQDALTVGGLATFGGTLSANGGIDAGSEKINNVADPTAAQDAATKHYTDTVAAGLIIPAGMVMACAFTGDIAGWIICDGRAISRIDFAALFGTLGTYYGAGDGSTTFNVPDYTGYFLRGLGGASAALGAPQASQNLSHNHTASQVAHNHSLPYNGAGPVAGSQAYQGAANAAITTQIGSAQPAITVDASGGAEARPLNKAVLWRIKT